MHNTTPETKARKQQARERRQDRDLADIFREAVKSCDRFFEINGRACNDRH